MIATPIMAPMKRISKRMEIIAKKETPAVQHVMRQQTRVYAMVMAPMETEATFLLPKSRLAEKSEEGCLVSSGGDMTGFWHDLQPNAPVMMVAQQNAMA